MMRIMFGLTQRSQVLLSSSSLALRLRLRTPLQLHITSLFSTAPSSPPTLDDGKHEGQRVSVWWNIDNRATPTPTLTAISLSNIVQSITEAVTRTIGINIQGPLEINAFGHIPCFTQQALTAAGVNFIGLEKGADRSPLVDWVSQNPPPAHIFLICTDTTCAGIMDKLRTSNKNILLASREAAQTLDNLYRPASIIWHWSELVNGENLCGKHFELLPGRYFSSWYLIYKGHCEDPFTMAIQIEDSLNAEKSFYYRHRLVPEVLLHHLMDILYCFPGGLTIVELRNELEARNVPIDKVFYGYEKFLHLLLALPHIVDVRSCPDGQFIVHHTPFVIQESVHLESTIDNVSRKMLLEEPFVACQRQNEKSPKIDSSSNVAERSLDYEHRRVPEAVLNLVGCIAKRYPEGVSITEFHNELEKYDYVPVDKGYYGHGTLSRFLLALPILVEVESLGDGEIFVRPASTMVSVTYYPVGVCCEAPQLIDGFPPRTRWVNLGSLRITKREPVSPERLPEYPNGGFELIAENRHIS